MNAMKRGVNKALYAVLITKCVFFFVPIAKGVNIVYLRIDVTPASLMDKGES